MITNAAMLLLGFLSLFTATLCLPSFNSTTFTTMPNTSTSPSDVVNASATNATVTHALVVRLNSSMETVNTTTTQTPNTTGVMPSTTILVTWKSSWTSNETNPGRAIAAAKLFNNSESHNTTFPFDWNIKQHILLKNPGLVAIICIFCIFLALVLFVGSVKCVHAPKSNFERLEEVPLGKVTEESPFARY
ncbi:putative LOC729966 homolog [Synchiropus picturatus]